MSCRYDFQNKTIYKLMNIIARKTVLQCLGSTVRRTISHTARLETPRTYDGEGKTTLHVMNRDQDLGLMIDGYSQVGFKLNNNLTILGPMIIFPRSVLAWNVGEISDVTEESLCLFSVLEPKIDILVLGTGDRLQNTDLFKDLLHFSRKCKIAIEILPTESACPTFNFLNAEGRNVVGALLPPKTVHYNEDDEVRTKLRYQNVLEGA